MQANEHFLEVSHVSKQQNGNPLLRDISFTQKQYQKLAIMGETGSGKTTLMKIIGGLEQADEGNVYFEGTRVKGKYEQLIPGHRGVAYLSQYFELRNHYWVYELLSYANELPDEEAGELYKLCRIEHLTGRRTDQLSGGEKQRIALTLLLIKSPKLLLLDEPFSNLDMIHKNILKDVLKDVSEKMGISSILISHDPLDILSWADELVILKDGSIVQQGSPQQVYTYPVNEYAAGLLGKYNVITSQAAKALNIPIEKNGLIRPEELEITFVGKHSIKGCVNSITYFGSHCDIEAKTDNGIYTLKVQHNRWKINDTIHIAYRQQ